MSYFLATLTLALNAQITPQTKAAVIYGDEGFTRVIESGPHVQILEDAAGDAYDMAPTTQGGSSPTRYRKWTGVMVKIKGASSKSGATVADHRGVVEALADLFVISLEEVAHAHSQNVRNVTGVVVDDASDEGVSNPASAFYLLRFQYCRALNKAKALVTLQGLIVGRGIIAHRMVIPVTPGAAVTGITGSTATVDGFGGLTDPSWVGKTLTLAGGTPGNVGDFPITAVLDDSTVQITNAAASVGTGLSWSVSDNELAQES